MLTRVVEPYREGRSIVLKGRTIELTAIKRIRIFRTSLSLDNMVKEFEERKRRDPSPHKIFGASPEWKAIETGEDVTDEFITGPPGTGTDSKINTKSMPTMDSTGKEKIFVVHGHDNALKDEMCVFLTGLGFDPVVLHRQPDEGLTVIEKFEKHADVRFAFVLLTPDDYGFKVDELKKPDDERKGEFRARQNVIFELGFFIGKLGRKFVCCIYKNVSIPTDLSGLIYKEVTTTVEEIGYRIIKDLQHAGLNPKL